MYESISPSLSLSLTLIVMGCCGSKSDTKESTAAADAVLGTTSGFDTRYHPQPQVYSI